MKDIYWMSLVYLAIKYILMIRGANGAVMKKSAPIREKARNNMADIELVIKIDEEQYEFIKQNMTMHEVKNYHAFLYDICGCIKNGTPLPKGHGRLIDADDIDNHIIGHVDTRSCPTII